MNHGSKNCDGRNLHNMRKYVNELYSKKINYFRINKS